MLSSLFTNERIETILRLDGFDLDANQLKESLMLSKIQFGVLDIATHRDSIANVMRGTAHGVLQTKAKELFLPFKYLENVGIDTVIDGDDTNNHLIYKIVDRDTHAILSTKSIPIRSIKSPS